MNTRKFSRTLEEAFGPGHRGNLHVEATPMILGDKIIVASFCAALGVVFAVFVLDLEKYFI
jgi:hypothetical protein